MSNTEIPITDASNDQLLHFAQVVLNLPVSGSDSRNKLIAHIKAVHERDTIPVGGADAGETSKTDRVARVDVEADRQKAQAARAVRQLGDTSDGPMRMQGEFDVPHYRIEIAKAPGPDGDAPVEVWVNGRSLTIPRGERVDIPGPFLNVLQDAVHIEYTQSEKLGDNGREVVTNSHEAPRYNIRIYVGPYYPEAKAA